MPREGEAVTEMFRRYFSGMTTLNELAVWLNDQGLRTRNTRKLTNPDGSVTQGPRLFTNASVRVILHNAFYAGLVKHRDQLYPGAHEALVSREMSTSFRTSSGRTAVGR